jgi:ABC-type Mn2+/Zn2+ transport system ATPase subunit
MQVANEHTAAPGQASPPGEPAGKQRLIAFRGATLGYGHRVILRDVTLELYEGDFLGIVGPNGAGKSTLVKNMLRLLRPLSGSVTVGKGSSPLRFGYVPQRETVDTIFPLQVREIVAMGRYGRVGLLRRLGRADWAAVEQALARVGIADLARRGYGELSGGQRQRTLIARALAAEPDLLILDEPTNGMDLSSEHALLELVRDLHDGSRLTVVLVTHLLNNVANYAQRIAIITGERLGVGPRDEMLTGERLSALYGVPVVVDRLGNRIAIMVGSIDSTLEEAKS